jgi:hypothetical protein
LGLVGGGRREGFSGGGYGALGREELGVGDEGSRRREWGWKRGSGGRRRWLEVRNVEWRWEKGEQKVELGRGEGGLGHRKRETKVSERV